MGTDYYTKLIAPALRSESRRVVGRYTPEELYSTRRDTIEREQLSGLLTQTQGKHLEIEAVLIRSVDLPASVRAAIDQKLADNRKLARQPRTASYYSLSDSWHINASVLATIGAALFVIGCFCGSVLWRAPELPSKDPVLAIVPTPASACRVVNYVFRAKDCRIPERDRQHAVDALRQEKQP